MQGIFLMLIMMFVNGIAIANSAEMAVQPNIGQSAAAETWKNKVFTTEELKKYNGKNGMPAYAAVDGIVYDLTNVKPWSGGYHMKMHNAGNDLTDAFKNKAPKRIHAHVLEKLPKVGVLVVPAPVAASKPATTSGTVVTSASVVASSQPAFEEVKISPKKIGKTAVCPIMKNKFKITKDTQALKYKDNIYYFCCPACPPEFRANPEKYIGKKTGSKK